MKLALNRTNFLFACSFFMVLVGGCGSSDPSVTVALGDVLLHETFMDGAGWDVRQSGEVAVGVYEDAYRIQSNISSFVRGFYRPEVYGDVVIRVRGVQFSPHRNTAFGVICRAETTDRRAGGYYFLIGADGSYSIRKGMQDQVVGLVKWTRSGVVNQGLAANDIRAVCVGDYLALYVNGEFLAEARDDTYHRGSIALTAAVASGEMIEVAFDDLVVMEGYVP